MKIHTIRIFVAIVMILNLNVIPSYGDTETHPEIFYVESWKKGTRLIEEQEIVVELNRQKLEYRSEINGSFEKDKYELFVRHTPIYEKGPKHEYWDVLLSKKVNYPNKRKALGYDLLAYEKPGGSWKHVFWQEDNIARLYPLEESGVRNFLKYGVMVYPFSAKRVVKVENFYCVIQVLDYKMSKIEKGKLDSLTVKIEFTNKYDDRWKGAKRK